jgi:hypothetical protein
MLQRLQLKIVIQQPLTSFRSSHQAPTRLTNRPTLNPASPFQEAVLEANQSNGRRQTPKIDKLKSKARPKKKQKSKKNYQKIKIVENKKPIIKANTNKLLAGLISLPLYKNRMRVLNIHIAIRFKAAKQNSL